MRLACFFSGVCVCVEKLGMHIPPWFSERLQAEPPLRSGSQAGYALQPTRR